MENLEYNQFFNTNVFGFGLDYFFSSRWLYYGAIVVTIIFLYLLFLEIKININKNKSKKPNDTNQNCLQSSLFSLVSPYLAIVLIISLTLLANWSMEASQEQVSEMNNEILNLDFKNHVHNEQALKAYNYYVNDKKIKSWESKAFKKGLTILNVEDVKYLAEEKINKKGEIK